MVRCGAKPTGCALTASYFSHRALAVYVEPVICLQFTQALLVVPKNASMTNPTGGNKEKHIHSEE